MFEQMQEIKKAVAEFQFAQDVFKHLESKQIVITDGQKKNAIDEAKALMSKAQDHRVVIEHALAELVHPETAQAEVARILQAAQDHNGELAKFFLDAKALVGGEFEVINEAIKEHEALAGK